MLEPKLKPRYAWMNPETSSGIFGEFNSMRGLFWTCSAVTDMNFLCVRVLNYF